MIAEARQWIKRAQESMWAGPPKNYAGVSKARTYLNEALAELALATGEAG